MKRTMKTTILVVLMVLCLLGTAVTAYAAGESFKRVNVTTDWVTIASDGDGMGYNVKITGSVLNTQRFDVQMLGANGQVLWRESNSCPALGSRVYACGSDVYEIQVKCSESDVRGTAIALKTSEPAD